jgi:sugar phosphate isomerase/epimerase
LLCREAAEYGTSTALEMMPFSQINNFFGALSLVESAGAFNGGLLLDLWHVARGGMNYNEISTMPIKRIVSVELDDADAQPQGSLWEDTLHHRRLCGEVRCDRTSSSLLSAAPGIAGSILLRLSRGNTGSGALKTRRAERLKLL